MRRNINKELTKFGNGIGKSIPVVPKTEYE
jgi:hypothetical protein